MGFLRALMVPIFFVLYVGLFGAVAVAVVLAGAVYSGIAVEELQSLIPTGAGVPPPFTLAAAAGLVAALFIGMIAMFIAEHVTTVGRFIRATLVTALWFAVPLAGLLAFYLNGQGGEGYARFLPAAALVAALPVAAIVCGILFGLPFLWWVSERPPARRVRPQPAQGQEPPAPLPPQVVIMPEPEAGPHPPENARPQPAAAPPAAAPPSTAP